MDKAHKLTDKKLLELNKLNQRQFLNNYKAIRESFINEYSKINLTNEMTNQDKLKEASKYGRLNKIIDIIVLSILGTNKTAIKNVNSSLKEIYQLNYNTMAKDLEFGLKSITKSETVTEVKQNLDPFNEVAIDNAKDRDQITRKVRDAMYTAIFQTASVGGAFALVCRVYESNLKSMVTIATTQATYFENLARYDAMLTSEKKAERDGYVLIKTWETQDDDRVRDAHARADGQQAEIDKPFFVGGEQLMFPGDINASAGNRINCRCYISYKIVKK